MAWLSLFAKAWALDSICFYYNKIDSVRELINYQRAVVESQYLSKKQLLTLKKATTKTYVYLSVGEIDGSVPSHLKKAVKTRNDGWKSSVMDVSNSEFQKYILDKAKELLDFGGNVT